MNRIVIPTLVLCLMVTCVICGYSADQKTEQAKPEEQANPKAEQATEEAKASAIIKELRGSAPDKPVIMAEMLDKKEEQEKAIAAIEKLGGKITRDTTIPDKPRVVEISLEFTNTYEIPDELKDFPKMFVDLKKLSFMFAKFNKNFIKNLAEMKQLQSLDLTSLNLSDDDLYMLDNLGDLEKLVLHGDFHITDEGLKHLKGLKNLRYLDLSACNGITDKGLENLSGLSKLQILDLTGHTTIRGEGFAYLKGLSELRELRLQFIIEINESRVNNLASLRQLEKLYINNTKLPPNSLEKLRKSLPNCKIDSRQMGMM
jgi:hypothetical protein